MSIFSRLSFLLSIAIMATVTAVANDFDANKMAAQRRRPTTLEIYQSLGNHWPATNPVMFQKNTTHHRFLGGRTHPVANSPEAMNKFLMDHLPRTIARLESLFPNATWALLGRDSVLLADALEAYYLSIGQKDRVVRIDMSTGSFNTPPELIAEYLQSLGAPTNPKTASKDKPWIVIDRTSFGGVRGHLSGARQVVDMIYSQFINNGGDPAEFSSIVNSVSLHPGNGDWQNGPHLIPFEQTSRADYLASQGSGFPQKIVAIGSLISDGMEWHSPFGQLQKNDKGFVEPLPGAMSDLTTRQQIIWEIINSGQLTSSPEFQANVDAEFVKLGLKPIAHIKKCDAALGN